MANEVIMKMVDAGYSMDYPFEYGKSRFGLALSCVMMTLQQKIFNNSNHYIGFGLFGDDDAEEDGNSLILQPISKPTTELVRKIQQLSKSYLKNSKPGGDIFMAIERILLLMCQLPTKKSKLLNRRAFLFTNGQGKTNYTADSLFRLAYQLQTQNIKLNIIPIDFMITYNLSDNNIDTTEYLTHTQLHNASLLCYLKQSAYEHVQIFPALFAIELYSKFRKKNTNPIALFRGNLQIAPGLNIECYTYKVVRRYKLRSLCKYDLSQPFDKYITNTKDIHFYSRYFLADQYYNGQKYSILPEQQANAYLYGPHLIPISEVLEANVKIQEEKNFRMLGFVDKTKIPRHSFMGEVDLVVPKKPVVNLKLFTALVSAMISLGKYAIARYVSRSSKSGVTPKMVALIPYRTAYQYLLYLVELPTVYDVRDYSFNPLKPSTDKQKYLVHQMVTRMRLYKPTSDEYLYQVKVDSTFNPMRQYFYQSIFHRALIDDGYLPPLDDVILKLLKPEYKTFYDMYSIMPEFKKEFKLVVKPLNKDNAKKKSSAILWSNLLDDKSSLDQTETRDDDTKPIKPHLFDDNDDYIFNISDPIISFRKMLNNNKIDLVESALKQFTNYIVNKKIGINSEENIVHLLECVGELRKGCEQQKEYAYWDSWLEKVPYNLGADFMKRLMRQGLGYLKRSNIELFKPKYLDILEPDIYNLD